MGLGGPSFSLIWAVISVGIVFNAELTAAAPFQFDDVSKWIHNAFPSKGYGIRGEIKW